MQPLELVLHSHQLRLAVGAGGALRLQLLLKRKQGLQSSSGGGMGKQR